MIATAVYCAICGHPASSTAIEEIESTDTREWFSIERCDACGALRTAPVPADLSPYYATDLAATMKHRGNRTFAFLRELQLSREVRRLAASSDAGTILDVGCGNGSFVAVAQRQGHAVIAADTNAQRPETLIHHPDIPYVQFDFETLALGAAPLPGPYTVVLRHVLEHARDPAALLRELVGHGGSTFYIVVPNADSYERKIFGKNWYLWDPPRHLWHFDQSSLHRLCDRAGLETIAHGFDTTSTLLPCLYRYMRLRDYRPSLYERFGPTSFLTGVLAPLSLLIPGNVLWLLARCR